MKVAEKLSVKFNEARLEGGEREREEGVRENDCRRPPRKEGTSFNGIEIG